MRDRGLSHVPSGTPGHGTVRYLDTYLMYQVPRCHRLSQERGLPFCWALGATPVEWIDAVLCRVTVLEVLRTCPATVLVGTQLRCRDTWGTTTCGYIAGMAQASLSP